MKKVLIIAYFFPPLGWSGVQRTLKYVKYLRNFGWEPVVVTVGNTKFSIKDESLLKEIPEDITIVRIDDILLKGITDPFKKQLIELIKPTFEIAEKSSLFDEYCNQIEQYFEKIRNMILLPDSLALWAQQVAKKISLKMNLNTIDLIYTTSGPYSSHLVGFILKRNFNIPWVADFRDEWTNNPYFHYDENDIKYKIERELETKIVSSADRITTTTPMATRNYIKLFNLPLQKVVTITNGFDEEDFRDIGISKTNSKFTIVHNGSFYLVRDPFSFLRAIYNLIEKNLINKEKICIKFLGKDDEIIKNGVCQIDVFKLVEWVPYLPHLQSIQESNNSDLLLLVAGAEDRVKSMVPGKLFEYMRIRKPILAISPKGSVIEDLLIHTGTGNNFGYNDIHGMEEYIFQTYRRWINGNDSFSVNESEIMKYGRKNLTQKLAAIFDQVTSDCNTQRIVNMKN